MDSIDDPNNVIGIASLINKHHTNGNLDLAAIEKDIMGTMGVKPIVEKDPAQEFRNTIKELEADTGINLDTESVGSKKSKSKSKSKAKQESSSESESESDASAPSSSSSSGSSSASESSESSESASETESESSSSSSSSSSSADSKTEIDKFIKEMGSDTSSTSSKHKHKHHKKSSKSGGNTKKTQKGSHLDEALKAYSGNHTKELTAEEESEEDIKAVLLEDIDELKTELEQDGTDISRIAEVDTDSSIEDVRRIHKILRMKYDRKRCNSFGTEIILSGTQALEYLFDGERKFGPYSPNLVGWSNTVRPKLRKLKYETNAIVSSVMQSYNIGPVARMALELVPSAILYSKLKKDQHGKTNYNPNQMSQAFEDLRELDDLK